jgi:hypothetical protein
VEILLRPGEKKILEQIKDNPKSFTQLHSETRLDFSILSPYLKNLQKLGLVTRDVDTRLYRSLRPSLEVLFFHDLLDFLRERTIKHVGKRERQFSGISYHYQWLLATESIQLEKALQKRFSESEMNMKLAEIGVLAFDSWKEHKLSGLPQKDRNIVQKYRTYLLDIIRKLDPERKKNSLNAYKFLLQASEAKLKVDYPGIRRIPKLMVCIHAARTFREIKTAEEKIMQPWDLDDLKERVSVLLGSDQPQKLSDEEEREICERLDFLQKPKNRRIYEKHRQALRKTPKSVLVCPMSGFGDYPAQLSGLLSGK